MPIKDSLTELIDNLDSKHVDERRYAMRQLALMGAESTKGLVRVLSKGSEQQRHSAALILGKIRAPESLSALAKAMKDECVQVRGNAALALGEFGGTTAVQALIKGLRDEDWWVRSCSAEALGWIGDKRAIQPLVKAFQREEQEAELVAKGKKIISNQRNPAEQRYAVRPTIIESIKRIGGKEAKKALKQLGL